MSAIPDRFVLSVPVRLYRNQRRGLGSRLSCYLWLHVDKEVGGNNSMIGLVYKPPDNSLPGLNKYEAEETYFVLKCKAAF